MFDPFVGGGVVGFEFLAGEGVEVVFAEVGLGHFGEEFHGVVESVVANGLAVDVFDGVVLAGGFSGFVGGGDAFVVEAEDLVVVGVGEFVEDHVGLVFGPSEEFVGVAEFDTVGFVGVVFVLDKPFAAGVVDHGGFVSGGAVDPDDGFLEGFDFFEREEGGDLFELAGQEGVGLVEERFVFESEAAFGFDRPTVEGGDVVGGGGGIEGGGEKEGEDGEGHGFIVMWARGVESRIGRL